jgi:hypothetical protein
VVLKENLVTDRFGFLPERRLTDSRMMVKYVHTLSVGLQLTTGKSVSTRRFEGPWY